MHPVIPLSTRGVSLTVLVGLVVLLAHGVQPTRTRAHGRVNREQLAEIDLHWHDLRHEAACRWLAKGLDLRDSVAARPC
jgi:hypothetical protein